MTKIIEFFKRNRYALIWTMCYGVVVWSILKYLFNFDMFLRAHWVHIANAQLTGFAGFVFGILMLAAVPVYIATTAIIVRTKKPLITVPTPWFMRESDANKSARAASAPTDNAPTTNAPEPDTTSNEYPSNMPRELRAAFARARQHIGMNQTSCFNMPPPSQTPMPEPVPVMQAAGDIPLPTDFDIDTEMTEFSDAPVFSEIKFDDDNDSEIVIDETISDADDVATMPIPQNFAAPDGAATGANANIIAIANEFAQHGHTVIRTDGDIIITDRHAIVVHDDNDFWVADDVDWFAAGKQKPSPITAVRNIAGDALTPVIYLKSNNIMDLDARRTEWEKSGVIVITEITEL